MKSERGRAGAVTNQFCEKEIGERLDTRLAGRRVRVGRISYRRKEEEKRGGRPGASVVCRGSCRGHQRRAFRRRHARKRRLVPKSTEPKRARDECQIGQYIRRLACTCLVTLPCLGRRDHRRDQAGLVHRDILYIMIVEKFFETRVTK